jgi:hypothetical protein
MKRLVEMLVPLRWLFSAALLFGGSMQASEPAWVTVADTRCPLVRREFTLAARPTKAIVRIVGLGHFELRVNGKRAGDAVIRQPWSQYDKTIYFDEIDIAPLLRKGNNVIGVMLGNSFWYNPPSPPERYHKGGAETDFGRPFLLRVEAEIDDANGGHVRVVSDASWKTAAGPVTFSHVFGGEDYDARLESPGWDAPGFDDRKWTPASVTTAPAAKLEKQFWPPLREKEVFPAKTVVPAGPGVFHVFFGQNASGILRFTVKGKAGQSFTVQPSEYRSEKGDFVKPRWGAPVLFRYTLKGDAPETHQWLFHYNGFQAIELIGAVPAGQKNSKGLPVIDRLELVHVRADLPEVGRFKTSSPLYNDTHRLIDWAMRSNMTYVLTDCPHREKLGWLECAHLLAPTFSYRYDCREWFAKIARDIRDAQEPTHPDGCPVVSAFRRRVSVDGRVGRGRRASAVASLRLVRRRRHSTRQLRLHEAIRRLRRLDVERRHCTRRLGRLVRLWTRPGARSESFHAGGTDRHRSAGDVHRRGDPRRRGSGTRRRRAALSHAS